MDAMQNEAAAAPAPPGRGEPRPPRARRPSGPATRAQAAALVIALASLAGATCPGCTSSSSPAAREAEAPSFNHVSETELQGAMWQLASGVARLDRILAPDRVLTAEDRLDVIRVLQRMEAAADSLGPAGWPSNHPPITRHLGDFREALARARRAVEHDPPAYALAGSVSTSCLSCHGGR